MTQRNSDRPADSAGELPPVNRLDPFDDHEEVHDDAVIAHALRWSLVVLAVMLALGGGVIWWLTRPETAVAAPTLTNVMPTIRSQPTVEIPSVPFVDITQSAGIEFVHENGAAGDKLLPETMAGGCAILDFDSDGDQDILLTNGSRWPWDVGGASTKTDTEPGAESESASTAAVATTPALFANDGSGSFSNVTAGSGLDIPMYGTGVACGDYDNDGRVDVFLSAVGPNHLFHNEGGGRFREVPLTSDENAITAGTDDRWSTSCGWFDYDNDADLDLFVVRYVVWSRDVDLGQNFTLDGTARAYGRPQEFTGTFPSLYRNDGSDNFTDVSAQAGLELAHPVTGQPLAKSLGLGFADLNADGRLDVVIANDTVQNLLLMNEAADSGDSASGGRFQEVGALSGVAFDIQGNARGAMGVDLAHFRNDASVGLLIGNFSNEMTALYVTQNVGGGLPQFTDEAVANGIGPVTRVQLTFGIFFFDCDLDGRLDVFSANGHLEEDINKVQPSQHYEQAPQLLWNCGLAYDNEFLVMAAEQCGADLVRPMVGRGAAYADIDGDGDLDVLIASTGSAPRLLRNDVKAGHHWLRAKLVGIHCNRDAIGAIVNIDLPDGRRLTQAVMPTRSYQSQVELPVTFGLGVCETVDQLEILWPDGTRQIIDQPGVDRLHVIEQRIDGA